MWDTIKRLLAPPVFPGDERKTRVAALINAILGIFIALCAVAAPFFLFLPNPGVSLPLLGVFSLINLGLLALTRRGYVSAASWLFLSGFWLLMTAVSIFLGGTQSSAYWGYIVFVVAAGLLLEGRGGLVFAGLSVVSGLGIALAQTAGMLPVTLGVRSPMEQWGPLALFVVATAGLIHLVSRSLSAAFQRAQRYAAELEEQRATLEVTVAERTRDLARRTRYLEATTAIAREVTAELELGGLMTRVVDAISRQFGFYHTGLFLIDEPGEWIVLQAASGEAGRELLARDYRLRVGQAGLVGGVAQHGEARIARDTGDAMILAEAELPLTRSQVALPLRARGQVIGVLDVQSAESEAFTPEDVVALQTLADQVATAISNARLFQQVEARIETERRASSELSGGAWADLLKAQTDLGFMSNRQTVAPVGDTWTAPMAAALAEGRVITTGGADRASLAIPIKVRNRVIGVIDGRKREGSGQWTPDEIALMQTLAEQSALALESARLYEDTQRRAAREQLAGEVTARIRESLDVEQVLQIAVREIGNSLGIETEVWLGAEEDEIGASPSG